MGRHYSGRLSAFFFRRKYNFRASQTRNSGLFIFRHRVIIESRRQIVLTIVWILVKQCGESVVFDIGKRVLGDE